MTDVKVPTYDQLMNPLLRALKELGGSGTIEEIDNKASEIAELSDAQLEILHDEKGSQTEVEYRLAWARSYLKKFGILENSARGVWALTPKGNKLESVDEKEVVQYVREELKSKGQRRKEETEIEETDKEQLWRDELLQTLLKVDASAFERLVQRLLRESGFIQVEVTGRSGDGGIDGKGIMRLGGFLSFHVIFQCKRYRGSVTPNQIRDFRGAMVGRADKGLFITTGHFTKEAIREATRDGAPPIDLVDGEHLLNKLKALSLGVKTEKVEIENVTIDHSWFEGI